jgi:hypothetical protein
MKFMEYSSGFSLYPDKNYLWLFRLKADLPPLTLSFPKGKGAQALTIKGTEGCVPTYSLDHYSLNP